MSQVIIFSNDEGLLSIITPNLSCGISIEEIARKDVPPGKPYHIIDFSLLPEDYTFFNAWETDFTNPTGHAIGADAWYAEQAAKEVIE